MQTSMRCWRNWHLRGGPEARANQRSGAWREPYKGLSISSHNERNDGFLRGAEAYPKTAKQRKEVRARYILHTPRADEIGGRPWANQARLWETAMGINSLNDRRCAVGGDAN